MNNEFKLTPFSIHFLNMMIIVFTSALCGSIISNTEHIPISIGLFIFLLVVAFAFAGFIHMKFKTVNEYLHIEKEHRSHTVSDKVWGDVAIMSGIDVVANLPVGTHVLILSGGKGAYIGNGLSGVIVKKPLEKPELYGGEVYKDATVIVQVPNSVKFVVYVGLCQDCKVVTKWNGEGFRIKE